MCWWAKSQSWSAVAVGKMLFGVARGNGNIVETVRRVEGTSPTAVDSARGPAVPENPPEQPHFAPTCSLYTTRQVLTVWLNSSRTRGSLPTQKFILTLPSVITHSLFSLWGPLCLSPLEFKGSAR